MHLFENLKWIQLLVSRARADVIGTLIDELQVLASDLGR
jgi:hypothetical protein